VVANLASLLFGAYRRDALALLLLRPETSLHVREIARITGKVPGTLLRELNQLADAGLLTRRPVGNQVHFQANPRSPVYEDLRNVLKKTAGVADVLREALEPVAHRITAAFIYGSLARGDERAGSDIDVMIVGKLSFTEAVHALGPAQEFLHREISPNVYAPNELRAKLRAADAFLKRVVADKKIFLIGGDDDLGEPASHRQAEAARSRQDGDRTPRRRRRA
jgi:predicted nucleotidyltransferase